MADLREFMAGTVGLCGFAGRPDAIDFRTYRVRELVRMLDGGIYEIAAQRDARNPPRGAGVRECGVPAPGHAPAARGCPMVGFRTPARIVRASVLAGIMNTERKESRHEQV